jgi:drug/metabolite transporter (DMT)-like permease
MFAMSTFGIIGACGHILLIIALGYAQASVLAPFTYLGVLFGAFWGFVFFAEVPGLATWIGAIVIIGAGLYVWQREKSAKRSA